MHCNIKSRRQQAALDFMMSYGIVLLVLAIAIYVIFELGIFNPKLVPSYCTPAPNFACGSYTMSSNGVFTFVLSQSLGATLKIKSIACSSAINATGNGPAYGNVHVLSYSAVPQFYPTNDFKNGVIMGGDQPKEISVLCYNSGGTANGTLGDTYIGYVWINYTYPNLPSNFYVIQQAVQFSSVYT
jgi:hypothetical protein